MQCIPDLGEWRLVDWTYFYSILSTLYPDYKAEIVHIVLIKRSGNDNNKEDEVIDVIPFLS